MISDFSTANHPIDCPSELVYNDWCEMNCDETKDEPTDDKKIKIKRKQQMKINLKKTNPGNDRRSIKKFVNGFRRDKIVVLMT